MDPNKILQAYVGRTQISRVETFAPWAKGGKVTVKRVGVFCNEYNELAFLCNGTDRHEIRTKNVNRCPLLNLSRRILKTCP